MSSPTQAGPDDYRLCRIYARVGPQALFPRIGVLGIAIATSSYYLLISLMMGWLIGLRLGPGMFAGVGATLLHRSEPPLEPCCWSRRAGEFRSARRLGDRRGGGGRPYFLPDAMAAGLDGAATMGASPWSSRCQLTSLGKPMARDTAYPMEHVTCPLCGADEPRFQLRSRDYLYGRPGEFAAGPLRSLRPLLPESATYERKDLGFCIPTTTSHINTPICRRQVPHSHRNKRIIPGI